MTKGPTVSDSEERAATREDLPAQRAPSNGDRTPEQIAADLAQTRERLAATVDSLVDRVRPAELAGRAANSIKEIFVDPETGVRTERIVKIGVAVAGTVGALILLRKLFRR
jgi:hypothetical protein